MRASVGCYIAGSVALCTLACGRVGYDLVGADLASKHRPRDAGNSKVDATGGGDAAHTDTRDASQSGAGDAARFRRRDAAGPALADASRPGLVDASPPGDNDASRSTGIDAAPPGTADGGPGNRGVCDWTTGPPRFGPVVHLANVNSSADEADPVISWDGLTLYLCALTSSFDVRRATRPSIGADFGPASDYGEINSPADESRAVFTADGLEVFVASRRKGSLGGADIFHSVRASTSNAFVTFTPLANVSTAGNEYDPFVSKDGLSFYYSPYKPAGGLGGQDILFTTRTARGAQFGTPVLLGNVNTSADEVDPSMTADGLVLVFGSTRGGTRRVWYATRTSPSSAFGTPSVVAAIPADASDPYVSADGCSVYFDASLPDSLGARDLYVVQAPR